MNAFSPSESSMWSDLPSEHDKAISDIEISQRYTKRELRIVTETNREQLPNFVAALERQGWMQLQPYYQRRYRWDDSRKSKLIESFIMNIPVPPCFLYESEFARYEVMDGQQRISAIWDFYKNRFKLKGLEQWPELNGRDYSTLPSEIRKGLDRRSISYIVLLKESAKTRDEEFLLRQQVFERLNTGGVKLENQEIRHCLYHSAFDNLIVELSQHPILRHTWGLPKFSEEELVNPPKKLVNNPHFAKMRDVEFVLRFFALRHIEHYRGGMQSFLDLYMVRSRKFVDADMTHLRAIFQQTIELAQTIFGDTLFRPWDLKTGTWSRGPQIAYADATLVSLSFFLDHAVALTAARTDILDASKTMIEAAGEKTFTGQKNTKADVQNRITVFKQMLANTIGIPLP